MVARTLLLKAEITLWRREAERFRLEVARSFAPYVAAILDRLGARPGGGLTQSVSREGRCARRPAAAISRPGYLAARAL